MWLGGEVGCENIFEGRLLGFAALLPRVTSTHLEALTSRVAKIILRQFGDSLYELSFECEIDVQFKTGFEQPVGDFVWLSVFHLAFACLLLIIHPRHLPYNGKIMTDPRNVLDEFKNRDHDEIVSELDDRGVSLEVAIENTLRDFNMGTIVRSANAFGVRTVHVIGRKQWNKRGAMMTDKYDSMCPPPTEAIRSPMTGTGIWMVAGEG